MVRSQRANRKKSRGVVAFLLFGNVVIWGLGGYLWLVNRDEPPVLGHQINRVEATIEVPDEVVIVPAPDFEDFGAARYEDVLFHMESRNAFLVNLDTREVLFEHRSRERAYPASLTKIMTVLVGIEQAESNYLTVRADFNELFIAQAAMVGFTYGETRTLSEVLHGTMLSSGADATTTLAYAIAGSYAGFVALMNETAERIGMNDTHFMNASGLHHDNHYSTAYDMALLTTYALQNERFRALFTTVYYPIYLATGERATLWSHMFLNLGTQYIEGGEILGGKTGFTLPAGLCLASFATNGDNEFLLVTLGASPEIPRSHTTDAVVIYEYFFRRMGE